jgi:L-lysine epsilon oxidase-like protein
MPSTFRIHPALSIARVGDADGPGFIGPEQPGVPANWNFDTGTFENFKVAGRIKRQGVRFRVFEFAPDGSLVGEALPGQGSVAAIEWTVHVANRKASFFQFHGPKGENGDFSTNGARNVDLVGNDARSQLEIDPGPKSISGPLATPVILLNPNPKTNQTIRNLGDISTDDAGRLIFFGGHGKTLQLANAANIQDYVNNDGWFDDVSDGPVSAAIVLKDGSRVEAIGAWVSVAPPDFAPSVGNVVSLYETIWDVLVRNPAIPIPDLAMYRPGGALARLQQQRDDWNPTTNRFKNYKPSYVNDIADVFQRAFSATFLHDPGDVKGAFHNPIAPQVWPDLGDPDPIKDILRTDVFKRIRDPNSTDPADCRQMPRGLGDEYCDEGEHLAGSTERTNPKRFFSLTRTQYAMFAQWAARNFDPDGSSPRSTPTAQPAITPDGLDRAALENCVGGPFFPGIEVSWIIRNPTIYLEPFRFQLGKKIAAGDVAVGIPDVTVRPGFLTQQMALPWQADFRDCKREPLTNPATGAPTFAMWWTGQRPDDVFPEATPDEQVPWTRFPDFNAADDDPNRYREMVTNWARLGFVARQDASKKRWLETERS